MYATFGPVCGLCGVTGILAAAARRATRCQSLRELVDLAISWLSERKAFRVKDSVDETAQAA
jgi:hypothetical protein